ncbi:MAG: hypothetical protein IJP90_13095 [Treponema sp.]|nr:hypothetical protein [Treponema sp.]
MKDIETKNVDINQKTGVWHYSSMLLKNNELVNSGRNQYALVQWLSENNKTVIKNDFISPKSIIKIPSTKMDLIKIICIKLSINKESQEYYDLFEEKDERIIIIGTQQHRGGDFITSQVISGGIFGNDVSPYNKMMFVHQAIREVRLNKSKKWTILLCTEGYSHNQIKKIKAAFYDKDEMEDCVNDIIEIGDNDIDSIINYINFADRKKNTEIKKREYIKVSHLSIYAHGLPDGIYFWMDDVPPYQQVFGKNEIIKLKDTAFSENSEIYCYSCRTGIGNDSEDFTKKGSNPDLDKSIAQYIANITGAKVYAYQRRTSYEDTLVKKEYRKAIECEDNSIGVKDYELLCSIWNSKTYLVDGAIFYPKGAFYPVKADSTPIGLTSTMCLYIRK